MDTKTMTSKNWNQRQEPFSNESEWSTENGTHIEVGDKVLAKPQYVSERLPAVVERIYWDPQGVPGGQFDHGDGEHDCILTVQFRFDVPEDHEYSHMDDKTHRTEGYNLDFVVGTGSEIKRDRSNCNA